jgi:hypothetical protein
VHFIQNSIPRLPSPGHGRIANAAAVSGGWCCFPLRLLLRFLSLGAFYGEEEVEQKEDQGVGGALDKYEARDPVKEVSIVTVSPFLLSPSLLSLPLCSHLEVRVIWYHF